MTAAVPGEFEFPLSFAQQRLWFVEQLENVGAAYTVRLAVRLSGALDIQRLQSAIDALVARHEALRTTIRTTIHSGLGDPVQVIAEQLSIRIERVPMHGASEPEVRRRVTALSQAGFDLARGPLFRALVAEIDERQHVLLLLAHHIVSDAWSSSLLFRDLAEFYNALAEGRAPQLPELTVQYADYAVWQREWLQGAELDRQLSYWHRQLRDAPRLLELPTDRPRPAVQSYRGSRWTRVLTREVSSALKSLAVAEGSTLFMVLVAAFDVLLWRYSGQTDIVIGTPVAGRRRTELEPVVGLFANTLALRVDLDGDPGFRELLARVKRASLEAFAHQDLPFEKLVDALRPARSLAHSPVFQVMLILQNVPWEAAAMSGLELRPAELDPIDAAKFDLTLSVSEFEGECWLAFEYNTDLFDAATVERMSRHFAGLLDAAIADPGTRIGDLALQPRAQSNESFDDRADDLLNRLNATDAAYPRELPLHALITARAANDPTRTALESGERCWTYAGLEEWSGNLARRLRAFQLQPGQPVAICIERSPEMVGALLGVLKAGLPYLPLDPAFPAERLQFMLDDAAAACLITGRSHLGLFPRFGGRVLCIEDLHAGDCVSAAPPPPTHRPEHPAYLIYTSGSTGRPKGVWVTHGGVMNVLASMTREPGLRASDRLLAVTTLGFDIAVLELLGPLINGATVVLASRDEGRDGAALARRLERSAITVMQATPATWRALLDSGWQGRAGLKMWCGGEALSAELAARLLESGGELWNMYGPTETTIWSTCARITAGKAITIGCPIANTQVHIVDRHGRASPVGVPGELLIGGAGVAVGYHGAAELTAARFVSDPQHAGARLYRTGDRVRLRGDGELEYLGRLDRQLKVRGLRIEPGEIESVLGEHATVAACAVALCPVAAGDERLVAYVVARPGAALEWEALRGWLQRRLPDYMIPAGWVALAALPLSANGKLDRQALPAPQWGAARSAGELGPRTAVEELLCGLFAEVLQRRGAVGIHEDFFALGGHSLLATQLVSRIRAVLEVELALKVLFEGPTVAALAAALKGATVRAAALPAAGFTPRAPLSYPQQRLWFLEQLQPGNAAYNLHAAYRLSGQLDPGALRQAWQALVARHEALRTGFAAPDGEPEQRIAASQEIALDIEEAPGLGERALQGRLLALAEAPFELARGPLWRVHLLKLGEAQHLLLVVMHHLISDGWSLSVLLRELGLLYNGYRRGRAPQLPALPVGYADYARWQRQWLQGEELQRQLGYWRAQLAGAPPLLPLPADRPRLPVQRHRGARLSREIPNEVLAALTDLARVQRCTLFMVTLAAFEVVLMRYSGAEELLIGTPVAGRTRRELEGLIGFFINTLVLRTDLSGNPCFSELLARVKRTALAAYANQDVPFEKLVDELKPPRDPGRTPVFQVMFNLHSEPRRTLELAGLDATACAIARQTSKFDLAVSLAEHAGGLGVTLEYNTDLFDEATVAGLAESYARVLAQVVRAPQRRIGELNLTAALVPAPAVEAVAETGTLLTQFAAAAARAPAQPAVQWEQGQWSYGELRARAGGVAQMLQAAGVPPHSRVGVLLGHDGPMVAGLLGVLAGGHAYVPLDRYAPARRHEQVLRDAQVQAILGDAEQLSAAPWLRASGVPLLRMEDAGSAPAEFAQVQPQQLAYILYTSGSSGAPKGVMQTHAHVLAHIGTWRRQLQLSAADRLSLLSGYGYDAAVQDVYGALLSGATLYPLDLRGGLGAAQLVDRIAAWRLTVLHATPTVYRHLFGGRVTCEQDLTAVRLMVLGGETARRADLELFKVRFRRGARLVNGYGLTECTMGLQYFADHDTRVLGQVLPIGAPVGDAGIRLLDADGEEHPWQGELELRSGQLTPGYLHDAGNARFGVDAQGRRSFRTGDRVRRLPDGQLLHCGRLDRQLKLRGIRIEPAEIEAVLQSHPLVREAVVIPRESGPGERALAGFVTTAGTLAGTELRAYLRTRLPEAMVPSSLVMLNELPKLPNGKVDLPALPAPMERGEMPVAAIPPRTEIEEQLAGIWCGVLKRERIGVYDDFFALGGHSLLATRLIARVRDAFRLELPLLALFESPTIAGMADALERTAAAAPAKMPELARRERTATERA